MHYQTSQKGILTAALLLLFSAPAWPQPAKLEPADASRLAAVVKSAQGQVVLMNLWATWCAPCREEMPGLVKLEARFRQRGFKLITVSADEPEQEADALRFLQQQRVPAPAFIKRAESDEGFITGLDPKWSGALPTSFLFDRTGRKVRSFVGEVEIAALEAAIQQLL
jgi:thiol-disulfide isomerase/thioredoxin